MSLPKKPTHPLLVFIAGLAVGVLFTAITYMLYQSPEDCKGDGLCESGQTILGGIFWGALMTTFLLPPLVLVVILIFGIVKAARFWKKRRGGKPEQGSK